MVIEYHMKERAGVKNMRRKITFARFLLIQLKL